MKFAELQDATWVIQRAGMPIRDAVTQAYTLRNLNPPKDTIDTSSLLMTLSYLESSDAIAPMTDEVTDLVTTNASNWRALPMPNSVVMSPYNLLVRRGSLVNPLCRRLYDLLKTELERQ